MFSRFCSECLVALNGTASETRIWQYNVDFVIYPMIALFMLVTYCRSAGFVVLTLAGMLLFTFAEYWVHRIALHEIVYHSAHQRHHEHPAEFTVFPIWYLPPVFMAVYLIAPLAIFTGFVVGYIWFLTWHDVLHHVDLNRMPAPVRRYALWHLAHHNLDKCNFGITVPFWDWLFGTYRKT